MLDTDDLASGLINRPKEFIKPRCIAAVSLFYEFWPTSYVEPLGNWLLHPHLDVRSSGSRRTIRTTAARRSRAMGFLNWRARHIAIRAEDAAISLERAKHLTAMPAIVEELAGVGRHGLGRHSAAFRAGQRGYEVSHPANSSISGCSSRNGHKVDRATNNVAKQSMRKVALVGGAVVQLSSAAQARRLRI